jgi:multidrug resistance efflux pump
MEGFELPASGDITGNWNGSSIPVIVRARVATSEQSKATLVLAQAEFDRAERLLANKVISAEEWDQRRKDLDVAKAQVQQALENVYQTRVDLERNLF